jgi:hypothetical protein
LIATAESVTELPDVAGRVLVAGSHGGIVAAHYAAQAGVKAVILNDAGIGKDRAGIAGLGVLQSIGMAAAAVDHASARIGDGADMLARGAISNANAAAGKCGVLAGMPCREAAARMMSAAPMASAPLAPYREGRFRIAQAPGEVWGLDSIGMLVSQDAGRILIIGSHAALHGGREESALPVAAGFAAFNDGGGLVTRLPVLDARGIAAVAVDCMSARIGDARSMWESGVVSYANRIAGALGVRVGLSLVVAVEAFTAAQKTR